MIISELMQTIKNKTVATTGNTTHQATQKGPDILHMKSKNELVILNKIRPKKKFVLCLFREFSSPKRTFQKSSAFFAVEILSG